MHFPTGLPLRHRQVVSGQSTQALLHVSLPTAKAMQQLPEPHGLPPLRGVPILERWTPFIKKAHYPILFRGDRKSWIPLPKLHRMGWPMVTCLLPIAGNMAPITIIRRHSIPVHIRRGLGLVFFLLLWLKHHDQRHSGEVKGLLPGHTHQQGKSG